MLLQITGAGMIGRKGVVATANEVFKQALPHIAVLHLAIDIFEYSLHYFHSAMTVAKARANRYENGTIYFGSRKSPFQIAVYDKLIEQKKRSRGRRELTGPFAADQLTEIRKHKNWVRLEARYLGPRCPVIVKHLADLDNLAALNPFASVRLRSFEAADPGRFTGIRFVLAHGVNAIGGMRIPLERTRALFGRNFPRFLDTHADLFVGGKHPDLQALYAKSIVNWLAR
jgi:hypothetical protein